MTPEELAAEVMRMGEGSYIRTKVLSDGSVAALGDLLFTRAIYLGCNEWGFSRRFCFENRELASEQFEELLTEDDVPLGFIARR